MKKSIYSSLVALIITSAAIAQPVSDRAVIPVAITLNQILRIHVINGGNIEFVFNTLDEYKLGIPNSAFYDTDVTIAASGNWAVDFGAEEATMEGTDNPAANTLNINNVGFTVGWTGTNTFGAGPVPSANEVCTGIPYTNSNATNNGLALWAGAATTLLTWGTTAATTNGGDITENAFTINWVAGTQTAGGTTTMNATSLLVQSPAPDRYVVNVLLELRDL